MKTNSLTEREQSERSSSETNEVKSPSPETNVISLDDYRKKKNPNTAIKQAFKDSLDNDKVMERYRIKQPTLEERQARIRESVKRINQLMDQLKQ